MVAATAQRTYLSLASAMADHIPAFAKAVRILASTAEAYC